MRKLVMVCAGLAIIGGIAAFNLWHQLLAERTVVAGLNARLIAAERRLSVSMTATSPPIARAATEAAQPARTKVPASQAPDLKSFLTNNREIPQDSDSRKAQLAQIRRNLPMSNPGMIQALGLSPDQAEKLWSLLAENELESRADPAGAGRKLNDSITALLGESGYQQWRAYRGTVPSRQESAQLNRSLELVGVTLSDAQMRTLSAALLEEQRRQSNERFGGGGAPVQQSREARLRIQAESDSRLIETMAPQLDGQQLDALRAELDRVRTRRYGASAGTLN